MDYHLLGKSGLRTARVALGTMTFGEDWGWGAPKRQCARLLDAYLDAGGNYVDSADFYTNGASETILGELIGGRRDRSCWPRSTRCRRAAATRTPPATSAGT